MNLQAFQSKDLRSLACIFSIIFMLDFAILSWLTVKNIWDLLTLYCIITAFAFIAGIKGIKEANRLYNDKMKGWYFLLYLISIIFILPFGRLAVVRVFWSILKV